MPTLSRIPLSISEQSQQESRYSMMIVDRIIGMLENLMKHLPPGLGIKNIRSELSRVMSTPPDPRITEWRTAPVVRNTRAGEVLLKITIPGYHLRFVFAPAPSVDRLPASVYVSPEEGENLYIAEVKAKEKLRTHLSEEQWYQYEINGTFFERSPCNEVLIYLFRRGFPLLVYEERHGALVFRVGLCLHAQGYTPATWKGNLCPTDDIITLLCLVRTDEHSLWKKANHHSQDSPALGI